jgi:hypothetical protein
MAAGTLKRGISGAGNKVSRLETIVEEITEGGEAKALSSAESSSNPGPAAQAPPPPGGSGATRRTKPKLSLMIPLFKPQEAPSSGESSSPR